MVLYLAIWTFKITQTTSFIVPESYNILLKDNAHYKIEESLHESNLEMIENDLVRFNGYKENKFHELNKLASNEYDKNLRTPKADWSRMGSIAVAMSHSDNRSPTTRVPPVTNHVHKRDTQTTEYTVVHIHKTKDDPEDYDYDYLHNEYYAESIQTAKSNNTYHPRDTESDYGIFNSLKKLVLFDTNAVCSEDSNGIGLKAINCLINDYKAQRQPPKVLALRLWKITKSWLIVYLAVAVFLWCTEGWCCCCLFCKFFKPQQTIKEAKAYLITNPPGVYKPRGGKEIRYKPTDCEKECFEEFEHLMKTI